MNFARSQVDFFFFFFFFAVALHDSWNWPQDKNIIGSSGSFT